MLPSQNQGATPIRRRRATAAPVDGGRRDWPPGRPCKSGASLLLDHRQELADVEGARLLGDLSGVLTLQLLRVAEHVLERLLQAGGVDLAAAGVIAFRDLSERIRGRERKRRAGG